MKRDVKKGKEMYENHPELASHLRDHCYSNNLQTGTLIPLHYADDICWILVNYEHSKENAKKKYHKC